MIVAAKCTAPAWESNSCVMLVPGGGTLSDGRYELERDSPLAELKIGGRYVFEFDRNANPADKPHDYSCKKEGCGAMFKTLADLGRHTNSAHKPGQESVQAAVEEEVFADRTCTLCKPARICKSVYGLGLHQERKHGIARKVEAQDEVAA